MLMDKVTVYQHKKKENKFKIIIGLTVDFKFMVLALANLKAWSKWHPNITNIKVEETAKEKNLYTVDIDCKAHEVNFGTYLDIHFFRVDNKNFLAMKSKK